MKIESKAGALIITIPKEEILLEGRPSMTGKTLLYYTGNATGTHEGKEMLAQLTVRSKAIFKGEAKK